MVLAAAFVIITMSIGTLFTSYVQQVWQLYVTFGLLVGAGMSAFYVPLTVLAIKWFEGRRGMAAAVVSAGNGLGILALAPPQPLADQRVRLAHGAPGAGEPGVGCRVA